jgi:hypothetical protein
LDPSETDWNGRNFWHLFCDNAPFEKEFPWKSICGDFRHILNEKDGRGRTSIFILSSNPRSNIELFRWNLNNNANISIPQVDGLTCLHAAIFSLEPIRETSYITLEDLAGYPGMKRTDRYSEKDRENQKEKIELLLRQGANIFAASNRYGTPTDIARLTRNFPLWIEALRNCGFDPTRVLAADKKVSRHQQFLSTIRLAGNLQREGRIRWQSLQDIFRVFDNFDKNSKSTMEPITPEWECLPIYPLVMCVGTYQEIFSILKGVLEHITLIDDNAEGQSQLFLVNKDIGGKYEAGFLHKHDRLLMVNPSYRERYNNLDKYLETLAKVASADHSFDVDTIDWKTHQLYVDIIKTAATLEWNCRSWFSPPMIWSMNVSENAEESPTKMPGSWPA